MKRIPKKLEFEIVLKWIDPDLYDHLINNIDNGKPWLIRRGRLWVQDESGTGREDGWWVFGYYAWSPKFVLLPLAILYHIFTRDNNLFYSMESRRKFHLNDQWLFDWPDPKEYDG